MNYNHLNYFYHVAKIQNLTKAASVLSISQPSLSAQIKTFEEQMGKSFFRKVGRNLELTEDGVVCLKYCEKIFTLTDELQIYLSGEKAVNKQMRFIIGITNQVAGPFTADLISSLKSKEFLDGSVTYVIKNENKESLIKKMEMGEIDLMLTNTATYVRNGKEIINREMPVALFMNEVLYKKIKQQLKAPHEIDVKKLIENTKLGMVIPSREFSLRHEMDFFLNQFSTKPNINFESDVLSSVEKAIMDGLGWGFMPEQYLKKEVSLKLVKKIKTKQKLWTHRMAVIVRNGIEQHGIVQTLKTALENL